MIGTLDSVMIGTSLPLLRDQGDDCSMAKAFSELISMEREDPNPATSGTLCHQRFGSVDVYHAIVFTDDYSRVSA